jgi:8-oxo-dGTP pyrophosphatase MutT (NUDIX family)/alkylhydroperoxidase/carboxymuconolactone decarboxylase family protein YurZ
MSMADYQGLNNGTRLPEQLPFILQNTDAGDTHYWDSTGVRRWGQYGAAGAMIRRKKADGTYEYLMIKRAAWVTGDPNKWSVPGGAHDTLEDSGNPSTTAARELLEELGLDIAGREASHIVDRELAPDWKYSTAVYDVAPGEYSGYAGRKTREIADTKWMSADEIRQLQTDGKLHSGFDQETMDSLLNLPDAPERAPEPEVVAPEPDAPKPANAERMAILASKATGVETQELENMIAMAPVTPQSQRTVGRDQNSPFMHDKDALAKVAMDKALANGATQEEARAYADAVVTRAGFYALRTNSADAYAKQLEKARNSLERAKRDLETLPAGGDRIAAEASVANKQRYFDSLSQGEADGQAFMDHVLDNSYVAVGIGESALIKLINGDGQYRNIFENPGERNRGAMQDPRGRAENEYALYDSPRELDPTLRPAFGYLVTEGLEDQEWFRNMEPGEQERYRSIVSLDVIDNIMGGFGDCKLTLKKSVLDRTSYSVGGSLKSGVLPRSITRQRDRQSQVLAGLYGSDNMRNVSIFSLGNSIIDVNGRPHTSFIEAQVHGRFTLDDVEAIYAPAEKVEMIQSLLRSKGIGIEVRASR